MVKQPSAHGIISAVTAYPGSIGTVQYRFLSGWAAGGKRLKTARNERSCGLLDMDAKRLFDILGAAAGIALTSPVLAGAALGVRLTLSSPVLFTHKRPGHDGEPLSSTSSAP